MNGMFNILVLLIVLLSSCTDKSGANQEKPNIILIVSDDQGISDAGFSGSRDILTPNIDKIANEGVIFTNGYVTHSYCSPSRAGLLTGRYQQRFGHEHNPPYEPDNNSIGLPLNEVLMSDLLKEAGYYTGAIGKWHLGYTKEHLPTQRGFDYWYGFSAGGRSYWRFENPEGNQNHRQLVRNEEAAPIQEGEYLTDQLTTDAMQFIRRSKDKPFFLYLAYNAPHTPLDVSKQYLEKTRYIERGERSVYAAMITAMDEGVGRIDALLSELEIKDNTIIVFISDNGGVTAEFANNSPYRGYKGMLFEGGIRVPFCISWKDRIPAATVYDEPVISLDLLPTFLSASGVSYEEEAFDGTNLIPYVKGQIKTPPHEALYWRTAGGESFAVRKGDYKLTKRMFNDQIMLFNLENDKREISNISEQEPEVFKELQGLYDKWDEQMIDPLWNVDGHVTKTKERLEEYNLIRGKASMGEKN